MFLKRAQNRFVYFDQTTKFLTKHKNINFVEMTDLKINPKIKGEHNLKNISLAVAVAKSFDIGDKTIVKAINQFGGIARRYEFIGKHKDTKVYIDYAHHPTEIDAFIKTFTSEFVNGSIVFQPHTYSRTKMLLAEFLKVFEKVENLYIFKEYPARENKSAGLSAKELYFEIKKLNPNVKYCGNYSKMLKILESKSAIAFVGAGDINMVAQKFVKSN